MKKRPIEKLVAPLRKLGADISYLEEEGYPPMLIKGKEIEGGTVSVDGSISSQYISALLLIAPYLKEGLTLTLNNKIISSSYIRLTINILKYFGADIEWNKNKIFVKPGKYLNKDISIEGDWSGASYIYEIASFCKDFDIKLSELKKDSFQGDSKIASIFDKLGVSSSFKNNNVFLNKNENELDYFELNFNEIPDMVQTFAVTLCGLNIPFKITGAESLKIKETDRIEALISELKKMGYKLTSPNASMLIWDGTKIKAEENPEIKTYEDHRMAMAFAPYALVSGSIIIDEPGVVSKSYPSYWDDLKKMGFEIEQINT